MTRNTRYLWILVLVVFVFGVGILSGVAFDRVVFAQVLPPAIPDTGSNTNFQLLNQAYQLINQNYVDRSAIKPDQLEYGAVTGMVDALGDTGHSRFMTPEMVQQQQNFTQGQFEGIGAEVETRNDQTVIVAPIDGSPAQKAGLAPGDIILKVDGQDMHGVPLTQVVQKILGPAGSKVTLTIQHVDTNQVEDITLVRDRINLQNVTWAMIPGTDFAAIRLSAFSNNVASDLKKALQSVKAQGAKGIILDMRNDPGGLLNESVDATSQFLKDGDVLQVKDAKGNVTSIKVKSGGVATDLPMVVLINQGTASAAEILSGALQDAGRAKLVGETTFGTGTVLNQFQLKDGSALLLATEEWLTPKGRVIWHHGIVPDVPVTLTADTIPVTPNQLKTMTETTLQASKDNQFLKAIQLLSGGG